MRRVIGVAVTVGLLVSFCDLGMAADPGIKIDTTSPVSLWSVVTFLAMWTVGFITLRMNLKKHTAEMERAASEKEDNFKRQIRTTCQEWWTSDEVSLKLERKIGALSEKIAGDVASRATQSLVNKDLREADMKAIDLRLDNVKLQLKNELLKEVIVLMNTKMVGGIKHD